MDETVIEQEITAIENEELIQEMEEFIKPIEEETAVGTTAAASGTMAAFLKVTVPEKEMYQPIVTYCLAISLLPE